MRVKVLVGEKGAIKKENVQEWGANNKRIDTHVPDRINNCITSGFPVHLMQGPRATGRRLSQELVTRPSRTPPPLTLLLILTQ